MAYKFSIGDYTHSGSITATTSLSGTTSVSGSTGTFGTLTVATFSPTAINVTSLTASAVSGGFVDTLTANSVVTWNDSAGQFANSAITSNFGALTQISTGLYVTGSISSSVGISASSGIQGGGTSTLADLTVNGNLTVKGTTTYISSSNLDIQDAVIKVASGSTIANINTLKGAGIVIGETNNYLLLQSGSKTDYWEFSGSKGLTDVYAGNIYATTVSASLQEAVYTLNTTGPYTITTSVTFVNAAGLANVSLPSASVGAGLTYKVKNLSTNQVVIGTLSGTIDNNASVTLSTQYAAASFTSDGVNWFVF